MNLEVGFRVRAQAHLPEDGGDVVLEETVEAPRHFERTTENGEGSGKLAMVFGVAQVKLHVSAREDSLWKRMDLQLNSQFLKNGEWGLGGGRGSRNLWKKWESASRLKRSVHLQAARLGTGLPGSISRQALRNAFRETFPGYSCALIYLV